MYGHLLQKAFQLGFCGADKVLKLCTPIPTKLTVVLTAFLLGCCGADKMRELNDHRQPVDLRSYLKPDSPSLFL